MAHGRKPSGKVKAEALEVILEKVKEEDLAASIGQHNYKSGQQPQIDPNEESYSFSLRNFPSGKISHSHGMKPGPNGRDLTHKTETFGIASYEENKNDLSYGNMAKHSTHKLEYEEKEFRTAQKKTDDSNVRVQAIKDNFI